MVTTGDVLRWVLHATIVIATLAGGHFYGQQREWLFITPGDVPITVPPYYYSDGLREGVQGTITVRLRYVDGSVRESEIVSYDLQSEGGFVERFPPLARLFADKIAAVTESWKSYGTSGQFVREVTFRLILDSTVPLRTTVYRVERDDTGNVRTITISARPQ